MVDMPRRPRVSSTTWWIKHQFSRSFTGELVSLWNQMVHIYFGVYNASICFYKTDKSCKNRSFIPCVKGSKMSPPVPVIPTASFLCLVVSIDSFYTWLRWCRHLQNWKQVNPAVTSAAVQSWSLPLSRIDPLAVCSPCFQPLCGSSYPWKAFEQTWTQQKKPNILGKIFLVMNGEISVEKHTKTHTACIHTRYTLYALYTIALLCQIMPHLCHLRARNFGYCSPKNQKSIRVWRAVWVSGNVWRHCLRNLHKGHLLLTWDFES